MHSLKYLALFDAEFRFLIELLSRQNDDWCEQSMPQVDLNKLVPIAAKHKLLTSIPKQLVQIFPEEVEKRYVAMMTTLLTASNIQRLFIRKLSIYFDKNKIEYVALKGRAYEKIIYDDKYVRTFFDLDILLRDESTAKRVHDYLLSNGFEVGKNWNAEIQDFERLSGFHLKYKDGHEYLEYYRKSGNYAEIVELALKVHSLSNSYTQQIISNRISFIDENSNIYSASPEDMFISMIENIYDDNATAYALFFGSQKLRDFYDLKSFLDKFYGTLDFLYIFKILINEEMIGKIKYVIDLLKSIFPKTKGCDRLLKTSNYYHSLNELRYNQGEIWENSYKTTCYDELLNNLVGTYAKLSKLILEISPKHGRLEEHLFANNIKYVITLEKISDSLCLNIVAPVIIEENIVFSINFFVYKAVDPFKAIYIKRVGENLEYYCHISRSFHSTGKLGEIHNISWQKCCIGNKLELSLVLDLNIQHLMEICFDECCFYSVFIHQNIVNNIYYHLNGDDFDCLFSNKPIIFSNKEL